MVGLTSGMVGSSGDGLTFFTVSDAMAIQFDEPGEVVRLERAARRARVESVDLGRLQPLLLDRAAGLSSGIPAFAPTQVSAVLVTVQPGADEAAVRRTLANWPDITVYSTQEQKDLLLSGMVDKARRQLGLFRALLIIISTIIIALIIYTLTLDKIRDIALLKLIGARNTVIGGLILQQSLLMGAFGYVLADRPVCLPVLPSAGADRSVRPRQPSPHRRSHFHARQPARYLESAPRRAQHRPGMNAPPDNTTPAVEVTHLRKVYGSGHTEVVAATSRWKSRVARSSACSARAARANPRC